MLNPTALGRWIALVGLVLVAIGSAIWLLGRAGLPIGQLPGDLRFQIGNATCFVPLATGLVLSLLLTLALNLLLRLLK